MAKSATEGFNQFLQWLVPSAAQRQHAATHRAAIEAKLDSTFGVFGMFESGSFSHGTGVSGKSDVDYFVSLKSAKPLRSDSILRAVRDALSARFPSTYVHVSRPAVVLEFGSGYERVEIIPAYYKRSVAGQSVYEIPGVATDWLESAPRAHLDFVNSCNQTPRQGAAKAMARLAKAWKYYREVPISSFYLEMRAAAYTAREDTIDYALDIYYFLSSLDIADLAPMNDPTGTTGRFNPCSSDATLVSAKSRLDTALGRARRAKDAYLRGDTAAAFAEWDLLFNGHFPAYT